MNEAAKNYIENIFPGLIGVSWKISSPHDEKYNCIAFAGIRDNIFWWPVNETNIDGVDWPFGLPKNTELKTFIELFRHLKYEVCDNPDFEIGFQKIAIYINPETEQCTHAARQKIDGVWTSKLGKAWDIEHPDPFVIEGKPYGKVDVIMKRKHS